MRHNYSLKKSSLIKKGILQIVCVMTFLGVSVFTNNQVFSQAASATWALSANATVAVTGNITATSMTGTGVTLVGYTAADGVQTNMWNTNTNPVTQTTEYLEFTITSTCAALTVQSISFTHLRNATAGAFRLSRSVNGAAFTTISDITVGTTSTTYTSPAQAIAVPLGQIIRIRLCGATNAINTTNLYVKNFVVTGTTTTVAPSVSIAAVPSGAICSGTSVTFTATPTNGGTTPFYQWKLNGVNVGANSATYTNAALANGNTVSCVLTSNLCNASPASATSNTITMTVNSTPATPGTITGNATPGPNTAGLIYSIAAVPGATTYTWTVPPGWSITSGNGTSAITVTCGAIGQNGNITVTAGNSCGTSAANTLAVTVAIPDPHNVCNQCHINHTAPAGALTTVIGNANLCISCHNAVGSASSLPFANSDKAIPGTSGTSHAWDKNAVNATYQTNMPTNAGMLARISVGQIICSTCHDQHSQTYYPYLRADNSGDGMCKDCHSVRNKGRYLDNTATNKSTHPVGITYNGADPRFLTTPTAPIVLVSSKVECSSCHKTHFASSVDGNILRMTYNENLCQDCHTYKTPTSTMEHKGMTCITCHDPHQNGSSNIYLIRDNIATPNSGTKAVVFTVNTSGSNYADGSATFNGVCEVCHTLTDHYTNTAMGTSDARHIVNPVTKCVTCHPHNKGFAAQTDCFACHNAIADKPLVGPVGGRRQIVDGTGNGLGTGGDYKRTSHHVTGSIPTVGDCIKCHYMGDHKDGQVKLLDPDQGFLNVYTYDPLNKSSVENFCLNCHDANGSMGDTSPFSDGVTVPIVNAAMWAASSHKTAGTANANTCLACHDNGHGSEKSTLIGPYNYAGPGTGTDLMNEEEGFCLGCHGAAGVATVKVHLAFSSYTNTTTNFYKHDPAATYRKHINGETLGASFTGTNRHVECVDCHNPHGAIAGTATAPALLPTMTGATGVEPIYGVTNTSPGTPTGFTWQSSVTQEYQVCYKCHSSYTTLPTYLPAGWAAAIVANGLGKLTFVSVGQVPDSRDMAQEYNPNNNSYHPVMAVGKNTPINAATFVAPWAANSRMYCSDCHDNPNRATAGQGRGPHGSNLLHILDGTTNFKTTESSAATTEVCSKCHQSGLYIGNTVAATNTRFYNPGNLHNYHVGNQACSCYMCHDSHGSEQDHLFNFNYSIAGHSYMAPATNSQNMFLPNNNPKACLLNCHTTHGTGGKTYVPAY